MKKLLLLNTLSFIICLTLKSNAQISGCMDPQSTNYNPAATINDGSCTYNTVNLALVDKTAISTPLIDECSGIEVVDGNIWTFADSGNPNDIYRISPTTSAVLQTIRISNATNVDWEDMTSSDNYLFVGDIGNNDGDRQNLKIYRINKSSLTPSATTVVADVINFSFSDQTSFVANHNNNNFDCESIVFMNDSIHLFSKNWVDRQTRHYVLPNVPGTQVARYRETFNAGFLVTSASVQNYGVLTLIGYYPFGTRPVSMWMIYDYKNNLLFNGNKRRFELSTELINGQVEGVDFFNSSIGYVTNERFSTGATVAPKLRSFDLSPYLPTDFYAPKPHANFVSNTTSACGSSAITFTDQSTLLPTSWQWTFTGGNPATSNAQNPQVQYSAAGNYSVKLIAGNSFGYDTIIKTNFISINSTANATISASGSTSICSSSSVTLNANSGAGLTYQWKKNTFNIVGATSSSYPANSAGDFTCVVSNSCGSATSNPITITVNPSATASISANGATTFCSGSTVTLSANTGAGLTYQWRKNSIIISGATNANYDATTQGDYTCLVSNNCDGAISNSITITVNALPSAAIIAIGSTSFCSGGSVTLNANTGSGLSYQWKNNSIDISGANGASYVADAAGDYTCVVTNNCGSVTSNLISVTTNSSLGTPSTPIGLAVVCKNSAGNIYSVAAVSGASSYTWTVPAGATITAGQGTASITVSFSNTPSAGNICVFASSTACGNSGSTCKAISIETAAAASPASITGNVSPCANSLAVVYTCATVANAISYTWTAPTNSTIVSGQGTNSVTLNFASNFSTGTIKVAAVNCIGSSATKNLSLQAKPANPGAVTGIIAGVCGGTNNVAYSISPVAGATGYAWTAPSNATIASGQGTTSVVVNFAAAFVSGNLTVKSTNACGTSGGTNAAIKSVPPNAGNITGSTSICANQTGVAYSVATVAGATNYDWLLPTGATIASGQNSRSITVNFGSAAGSVKVRAGNACGFSAYKSKNVSISCREANRNLITEFNATIFPNPSSSNFSLTFETENNSEIIFILRDLVGREIERKELQSSEETFVFGDNLSVGIYIAEIISGDERKIVRVVKE